MTNGNGRASQALPLLSSLRGRRLRWGAAGIPANFTLIWEFEKRTLQRRAGAVEKQRFQRTILAWIRSNSNKMENLAPNLRHYNLLPFHLQRIAIWFHRSYWIRRPPSTPSDTTWCITQRTAAETSPRQNPRQHHFHPALILKLHGSIQTLC